MDNKKVYSIQINGIDQSISQVDALSESLKALDQRIKELESRSVRVSSTSNADGGTRTADLQTEDKLLQQIQQTERQITEARKDSYQTLVSQKEALKDIVSETKQRVAEERLSEGSYANTMKGLKQELADIKSVMQTTDLGSEKFQEMSQRAGELTQKLKGIEEAYGQFGRNVGNYKSAAEGFKKLSIEVNGATREFDNAKQALMALRKERDTLGVGAGRTTKEFKELDSVVKKLESDIKDLSKSSAEMDNLLDTMESFAAIGSISTGFSSLFGFDNTEIEKSIQKMVALQNVLKGIETINKQIQTGEGFGRWIAPFTKEVDAATNKLLVYNRALLGTGKAATTAAVGIKVFGKALKGLATLGVMLIIEALIEKFSDLIDTFNSGNSALERQKEVQQEMARAWGEAEAKLSQYKAKVESFNGTLAEEKKLVADLNKELGDTFGTYKSLAEWKKVLKERTDAYIDSMIIEAQVQAKINQLVAAYMKLDEIKQSKDDKWSLYHNFGIGQSYSERFNEQVNVINGLKDDIDDLVKKQDKLNKDNKLFDYSPQIKKNARNTRQTIENEQRMLNDLELRLMKEGLNKKLRQLDEEERQTLEKLKQNAKKNAALISQIQEAYSRLRQNEINEYLRQLELSISQTADKIKMIDIEINIDKFENQIDELKNKFDELSNEAPIKNTLVSNTEIKKIVKERNITKENIDYAAQYEKLFNVSSILDNGDAYYSFLMDYLYSKNEEVIAEVLKIYDETEGTEKQKQMAMFKATEEMFEKEYANELLIVRNYTSDIDETLSESLEKRLETQRIYDEAVRKEMIKNMQEQAALNEKILEEELDAADEREKARYQAAQLPLQKRKDALEEDIKNFNARNDEERASLEKMKEDLAKIETQMEIQHKQHLDKLEQNSKDYEAKIKKNRIDTYNAISAEQEKYFNEQIDNLRDAQSKINTILSKQPVTNNWGIVNIGATKKQYKEIEDAAKMALENITKEKLKLEMLWKSGMITPEAKNVITQQLNALETDINEQLTAIMKDIKDVLPKFIQSINQYVQVGLQGIQTVMDALNDYEDYKFDKLQEELDKENEILQDKLDEQRDIVEEHKNAINSIEDELSTARGDRRQQLIDQLNAEMAAQRASIAQQKKIEKEKELNEKKQEELDKKRKKAEYQRTLNSILVSTALATANGLATQPFVPVGIAMGALATTLGMVQYYLALKQKPYAKGGQLDGGVAQGKRHRDGGIKVLGGRAEIEGGEFITNRITTSKNVDLLDYINSKKKRINLEDLIDFYGGNSTVKKNIQTVRTKFADGGVVPQLRSDINISDRLLSAFEDYTNRPTIVSVVDIIDRTKAVNDVRVMAGVE